MTELKKMLFTELKKSCKNKYFITVLIIAIIISVLSAAYMVETYFQTLAVEKNLYRNSDVLRNPDLQMETLYNNWIGGEYTSLMSSLFFFLSPLFATFSYGWSYCVERKSGYIKNVLTRMKKSNYFFIKYISVFNAGGMVVLIPMIINIMIVSMFVPAIKPDLYYLMYYGIAAPHIWSVIYFSHPLLYVILYLILDYIFAGLIATTSLVVTFWCDNKFIVMLAPFFCLIGINYIEYNIIPENVIDFEISPIQLMRPVDAGTYYSMGIPIVIECIILFIVTFGIVMKKGKKKEIY